MELTSGFIDTAQIGSQTPFYTPVIDNSGFWKIHSTSATVNGQKVDRSGNTAIADTGTTLCLVDSALCKAIYDQIAGSKSTPSSHETNMTDSTAKLKDGFTPSR